jgi:hypothetical protein
MPSYNKIGSCQMLSLEGLPAELTRALELIEHQGVDGQAFRQRGQRSAPFTLRSTVDQADGAAAATTADTYRALAGGDPLSVYDEFGTEWPYVLVLAVRIAGIVPISTPVGGLVPADAATVLLIADWTCQCLKPEWFA